MSAPPRLDPDLARELHRVDYGRNVARAAVFATLYALGAVGGVCLPWPLAIPAYLVAAASLHGISLFAHEAVHGTLAPGHLSNRVLGALSAIPVLQNCSAYRVLHLAHHKHLGAHGDPDDYRNYTRHGWMVTLMNWGRLLIGYPVYVTAIPVLGYRQGTARDRVGILAETIALLVAAIALVVFVPGRWLLHAWLVPMLFINTMVNIRGMSQHTGLEEADDEVLGTRSILTSPLVRFFMCNENYHLEHHLYPGVPWHHLPRVHSELGGQLTQMGAPYIASYWAFVREFLSGRLGPGDDAVML